MFCTLDPECRRQGSLTDIKPTFEENMMLDDVENLAASELQGWSDSQSEYHHILCNITIYVQIVIHDPDEEEDRLIPACNWLPAGGCRGKRFSGQSEVRYCETIVCIKMDNPYCFGDFTLLHFTICCILGEASVALS